VAGQEVTMMTKQQATSTHKGQQHAMLILSMKEKRTFETNETM
jgi:hypothetical protein